MLAAFWIYLIPLYVVAFLAIVLGIFGLLSRIRGGKYAAPIIRGIQKVPYLNKWLTSASRAALEKRNPDLASAIKKLERSGATRDPMRAQQALARLTPAERRAYMEAAEQQGVTPEAQGAPLGRAERRRMERMQKGMKRGR